MKYEFWPDDTLIIERYMSYCNNCGYGADPGEKNHETLLGYGARHGDHPAPCGIQWTHVASPYIGSDESVKQMRPDLELVGWQR